VITVKSHSVHEAQASRPHAAWVPSLHQHSSDTLTIISAVSREDLAAG